MPPVWPPTATIVEIARDVGIHATVGLENREETLNCHEQRLEVGERAPKLSDYGLKF
jgi:hypothetical protein